MNDLGICFWTIYLNGPSGAQAYAPEACKVVFQQVPDARDLVQRCGKLKDWYQRSLIYRIMCSDANGGTYQMKLVKGMFAALVSEN